MTKPTPSVPRQTLGEYRVGIDFNPTGNVDVGNIKRGAADLIDLLARLRPTHGATPENCRLYDRAMDLVEEAAMWGVKAATKPTAWRQPGAGQDPEDRV